MTALPLRRAAVAVIAALALTGAAHAAAPMVKTNAPAFYRVMLGDFEVTALSDGTASIGVEKIMTNTKPGEVAKQLSKHFLKDPVDFSINAYLVNTGSKLILVDTGTGGAFGPTTGTLLANLKAAGYDPSQIDEVYITHVHSDHLGGLSSKGAMVFPNAVLRMDKAETDFWLNPANADKEPPEMRDNFKHVAMAVEPYQKAGKLKPFEANAELGPGIHAWAAHGHTPGHSFYTFESKGQKLVLWGDVMHVAAIQFEHPEVTIQFDTDSKAAAAVRAKAFADAAKNGYLVGAAHIAFPGLGHVRSEGKAYAFEPIYYSPVH